MLPPWTIGLLLLATVRGKEVCYTPLGCFSDEKPWAGTLQRPLKSLPWSPEEVNTRFLLYTNKNPDSYQLITARDVATIKSSNFQSSRKTHFVIHGFRDRGEDSWPSDMCKKILQVETANCISVDWSSGAKAEYTQAVQNIRIVGAETAYLIQQLSTELSYNPKNVHIIGHSLGAHTAGEAGRRLEGRVGRVTGLDPAEPCFQDASEEVRLDPSDAQFVDVIHTDASPMLPSLGFGMSQKVGHMDFFPNGGKQMPGCKRSSFSTFIDINGIWQGTQDYLACNHLRSFEYYSSSILNPDGFLAYPCDSYDKFQENGCFPCPAGGCPKMGHYADQYKEKTSAVEQTFFLNTGESGDYTSWRYRVSITLAGSGKANGYLKVTLRGSNGNSKQYEIFKGSLQPDSSYTLDVDVNFIIGKIQEVKFVWNKTVLNLSKPQLGASRITVQSGADGTEYKFCGSGTVQDNVEQSLYPC
ncbi:pancreatic lipase-related protein 2 [Equus asinus]|uniref:pancreatic lipase-related protein 2 n=1 Tax=Equus asinus TaxID=9793 RepID=UPI00071A9A0D